MSIETEQRKQRLTQEYEARYISLEQERERCSLQHAAYENRLRRSIEPASPAWEETWQKLVRAGARLKEIAAEQKTLEDSTWAIDHPEYTKAGNTNQKQKGETAAHSKIVDLVEDCGLTYYDGCGNCKTIVQEGWNYCPVCGRKLDW